MKTGTARDAHTYYDAAPDFTAARRALVNLGPNASTPTRRAVRAALGRYLRRIRHLDPQRARNAAAWIAWIGWPVLLPEERAGFAVRPEPDAG